MAWLKRFFNLLRCNKHIVIVVLGCFTLLFSSLFSSIPVLYVLCAWLWPFCFLYYAHFSPKSYAQAVLFVCLVVGLSIRSYGVLGSEFEGAGGLLMVFASCVFWVPFAWDSAFCYKNSPFINTLVFPALYGTMNLILAACNVVPICNLTYAQYDNKPLLQLASVIGEFGITFLITWSASIGVYVVKHWSKPKGKRVGLIALSVLILLHIGGAIRYYVWPEPTEFVKVAQSLGPKVDQDKSDWGILTYERNVESFKNSAVAAFEKGSDILVFSEEAFTIEDLDEERFMDNVKEYARKFSMPILISLEIVDLDNDHQGRFINKSIIVDRYGEIVSEYLRHNSIPVLEEGAMVEGEGGIPMIHLDIGESVYPVSMTIGYDANFSEFIRGMNPETQLYFHPSWDWDEINDYHYRTVGVRSVEMGVNMVTTTNDGYSLVSDPVGKAYSLERIDKAGIDQVVIAKVPTKGTETIYSQIGWLFNMMYPLLSMFFIVFGKRRSWRRKVELYRLNRQRAAR